MTEYRVSPLPPTLEGQLDRSSISWLREVRAALVKVGSIDDLNQTITNPPTQAEVQAISDKIDELLQALRDTEMMES